METWKKIVLSIVTVLILTAVYFAYETYRAVYVVIPNSYAAWASGDLIVEYLKTHNDKWPRSWADLREARDSLQKRGETIYWDFDKLPKMVRIDWNADPKQLITAPSETPFRVVTKPDGSNVDVCWGSDTDPNRKVRKYLAAVSGRAEDGNLDQAKKAE